MLSQLLFQIVLAVVIHIVAGNINFALNKHANQSTTSDWGGLDWNPGLAVDGNLSTCSATRQIDQFATHTWEVDLGLKIIVKSINVTGAKDVPGQLRGFRLYIGNSSNDLSDNHEVPLTSHSEKSYYYNTSNVIARFVSLVRTKEKILVICEVTVHGDCIPGTYGSGCTEICGHCYNGNSRCSPTDGMCMEGCEAGWRSGTCNLTCDKGRYGYNCNETCGNCLYDNISCSQSDGTCPNGCTAGWHGDQCKIECDPGMYGFRCNETCGHCLNGNTSCSRQDGQCMGGCEAGWKNTTCKSECNLGMYGFSCNETCGHCLNGNTSCSTKHGQCLGGCEAGWKDDTCKSDKLKQVTSSDVGPDVGVIVGSSLAAVGVFVFAIVIIIVIIKKRKKNANETSAVQLTTSPHYANLAVDNAGSKINICSIEDNKITFLDKEDSRLQRRNSTGVPNSHIMLQDPDGHGNKEYEKLGIGSESDESTYSTIDHALMNNRETESMEKYNNFSENIQSLESALKTIEEEIRALLIRKENLLSSELEKARANKLREKRKEKDSALNDTEKCITNENFAETFQTLERELNMLEKKKKYLLERKEILLRNELSKIIEN